MVSGIVSLSGASVLQSEGAADGICSGTAFEALRVLLAILTGQQVASLLDTFPELDRQTVEADWGSLQIGTVNHRSRERCTPLPLNAREQDWIRTLERRNSHYEHYVAAFGDLKFGAFDVRHLTVSQQWIYEQHCSFPVPSEGDAMALCTACDRLADPKRDPSGLRFVVHSDVGDVQSFGGTKFVRVSEGEVHLVTRVVSSPNYMTVMPIENTYALVNGHHRAAALLQSNYTRALCLVVPFDEKALSRAASLQSEQLLRHRPTVADYVSGPLHRTLSIKRRRGALQLGLAVQPVALELREPSLNERHL